MGALILDLSNQANWLQVYDELRQVVVISPVAHTPIPAFEVPFIFDRAILAVKAFSATASPRWRFAGDLVQQVQLGTGGGSSGLPLATVERQALRLNRTEFVLFDKVTSDYQLTVECPFWLRDLRITIWEYVGAVSNSTDNKVDDVLITAARTEGKIDELLSRP
jgi:hypothetical protein